MKKIILSAFAVIALMSSCSTSTSALNDLREIAYNVNTQGSYYNYDQWAKTAEKYYKTDKKIAKYAIDGKYSDAEMQEIGRLQSDCVTGFTKGVSTNIAGKVSNVANLLKGIVDGFKAAIGE